MPENVNFVVAAYIVTWLTLIGYALRLRAVARSARDQFAEAERGSGGEAHE